MDVRIGRVPMALERSSFSGLMQCHGCFVYLSVPWSVLWSASALRNIGGRILRCTSLATTVRCVSRGACLLLLRWTTFSCIIKLRFDLGFLLLSSEVEKWGARILHSYDRKEATETAF